MGLPTNHQPAAGTSGRPSAGEGQAAGCEWGMGGGLVGAWQLATKRHHAGHAVPLVVSRKGPPQFFSVTPRVGGSEAKKGPGPNLFFDILMVFLNCLHRETPKKSVKKLRKKAVLDFLSFFCKSFRHDLLANAFL
jgi:hypothetical protein